MAIGLYILAEDGKTPIRIDDIDAWGRWFENSREGLKTEVGMATVSTVFLGLDHAFHGADEPVLWETMIFDHDDLEGYQERYSSYAEAMEGHERAVKLAGESPAAIPGQRGHE